MSDRDGSATAAVVPAGVILAAGMGSRLDGGPKPLVRLAGLTLLERAVATLRQGGVGRIIVVVGHAGDEVRRYVERAGLDVEVVENPDFLLGNGSSAAVGGRAAGGRFLVVMADHVLEPAAVERVARSQAPYAIAVDRDVGLCGTAEATKLALQEGRVVAVGRSLEEFQAVDAGVAVCDPEVVTVAERALAAGSGTWNDVKRYWLQEGRELAAVDVTGTFWCDVDTRADLRRAERRIVRRSAAKEHDGIVARLLNRRLSWPVSLLLLRMGLPPAAATALAFAVALAAGAVLGLGSFSPWALVAGGLLAQAFSVLDGVDGEMARARLRPTPAGAVLDAVLDRAGDAAILAGLLAATGRGTEEWTVFALALFGSLQAPYVKAAFEAATRRPFPEAAYRAGAGHDVRLLVLAILACAQQPLAALYAVAVLAGVEWARRLAAGWRAAGGARP